MANEVGGFQLGEVRAAPQSIPDIPRRVEKLRDGQLYRQGWGSYEVVATTLASVLRRPGPVRERNGMAPSALLVIDGCCKDHVLERLWETRRNFLLYDRLEAERPCLLVAPDISVYVDMPACHKLYQIKRTFVMYAHFQRHGLPTVPFFAPDNEAHALHLASWLRRNRCVTHVAASFQTLQRRRDLWRRHMQLLERIRDELLPRTFVWVLIGQRPRPQLDERLGSVRYVVAAPKFKRVGRSRQWGPVPGQLRIGLTP
jgi:hypothetical protein